MIECVIFDFADTVCELNPSKEKILKDFLNLKNIQIDEKKIKIAYHFLNLELIYSSVKISNQKDKKEFYDRYNEKLFKFLAVDNILSEEFFDYFNKIEKKWILKDKALKTFESIKNKEIKIGMISNFDSRLKYEIERLGMDKYLDFAVISQEVGVEKPNKGIYEYSLQKHSLSPTSVLYIGDSYVLDYLPSKEVGMNSLLFDEYGFYPKHEFVINDFDEIFEKGVF
ncbi:MAG: hypothetical protein QG567_974 [Campylobacterota bacterium]|nr:hypothetical protein [Campylobacterota bacterium]